jgi:hypothetical protein
MKMFNGSIFIKTIVSFIHNISKPRKYPILKLPYNVIIIGERRGPIDALKRIKSRMFDTKKYRLKKQMDHDRMERNKAITAKLQQKGPSK